SATPTQAFNLFDFLFPPVQMQPSTRIAPGPAIAPEVPSNDTYSNTLKVDTVNCNGVKTLSNTWEPEKKDIGTTDQNGQPKQEFVPYDAKDLDGEMDVKNLSNDYYRNFQLFFAKGGIKCTEAAARKSMNDLSAAGSNASQRVPPAAEVLFRRSQFLSEVALSLNQTDKLDTVTQDYQIIWSCSGTCQEMSNESAGNCRPVYASEIIFGLQNEKIYYPSLGADPTNFPGSVLTAIKSHYSGNCSGDYGCYSERSGGKTFSPLSKSAYLLLNKQINFVPKGNADNKVTVINWGGYNTVARQRINPSPTVFHRTLPNAAAATAKETQKSLSFINPTQQEDLPNASLCDSVETNSYEAQDAPVTGIIGLFVHGIFQHVPAGESYSHSESIDVTSTYDNQVVPNAQTAEKAWSNMLPDTVLKKQGLIDQKFSSKTNANKDNPIPDPGYRANNMYIQMSRLLNPTSWF
ncbi:MAG: hypothetical protein WC503_07060, partial [Candidatus Shapirobacteria bacterium]